MSRSIQFITRMAMASVAAGAFSAAVAADAGKPDLATAVREFQLPESARTVKELIPGWVAPKKIVVVVDTPERTAWLQQAMPPGVTVMGVRRDAEAAAQMADADALVEVNCAIAAGSAPKLRWVHANSGGGDTCLAVPAVARGEAVLTNSQKVKNTALAEMGMGYVFALARSVDVTLDNQRQRDLGRRGGRPGKRLEGATMLIVGLGGAGTEIARMAHAMGMKVIATDPVNRNPPDFVSHLGVPEELPALIGEADVVMVAAPLTPATRGLFNAALFERMKRDAIFVDWARADIVVAEDLAAALKSGTIGSAALNWATYSALPKDHPLWDAPNLILAPWAGAPVAPAREVSAKAARDNEMRWLVVRENMRRFATGAKMYSVFDLARGY
ncbi:MAG TPA: NAD(P)-dependent oxidoreductase [Steroidobacteraceae bacterium]|nr:NAD(P)-dependent oxidoreductase [Steroidobacteraceae bacterium]